MTKREIDQTNKFIDKHMKRVVKCRQQEHKTKIPEWVEFLKEDEDTDFTGILRVLQYKLFRVRKQLTKNNLHSGVSRIAERLNRIEFLLQRVIEDRYYEELTKPITAKYGHIKMIDQKAKPTGPDGVLMSELVLKRSKVTPHNEAKVERLERAAFRKADRMKNQDLHKAFEILEKWIWHCWD